MLFLLVSKWALISLCVICHFMFLELDFFKTNSDFGFLEKSFYCGPKSTTT